MPGRDLSSGDPIADRRADYAAGYADGGDPAAAADLMRQALDLAPGWAAGWATLADYLMKAGCSLEVQAALRRAAALDPADGLGAGARLAAIGAGPMPETLPPAFVAGLFDQYADRFDTQLLRKLAYRAPELLLDALRAEIGPDARFGAALDLGCGTGLMGELLRPLVGRLAGLDLSPGMLAKARAKRLYDELQEGDILRFAADDGSFDLVAAADVFNYIGDLRLVFAGAARWLAPGGILAFTIEAHHGAEPFVLRETMRYAHGATAVRALLSTAGFRTPAQRRAVLRQDRGRAVEGWVFVAQTEAASAKV